MRYAPEIAGKLLEKAVAQMKESSTYQKILAADRQEGREEGREEGERLLFLKLARRRLGDPEAHLLAVIQAASSETIESWAEDLHKVESWADLVKVGLVISAVDPQIITSMGKGLLLRETPASQQHPE